VAELKDPGQVLRAAHNAVADQLDAHRHPKLEEPKFRKGQRVRWMSRDTDERHGRIERKVASYATDSYVVDVDGVKWSVETRLLSLDDPVKAPTDNISLKKEVTIVADAEHGTEAVKHLQKFMELVDRANTWGNSITSEVMLFRTVDTLAALTELKEFFGCLHLREEYYLARNDVGPVKEVLGREPGDNVQPADRPDV
jgi:hypothetical protein